MPWLPWCKHLAWKLELTQNYLILGKDITCKVIDI